MPVLYAQLKSCKRSSGSIMQVETLPNQLYVRFVHESKSKKAMCELLETKDPKTPGAYNNANGA
ncbi:hypothetical protein MMC30_008310 [Trapelia coarctata]|nr:hypothetical protein [Trapelia coarctata]